LFSRREVWNRDNNKNWVCLNTMITDKRTRDARKRELDETMRRAKKHIAFVGKVRIPKRKRIISKKVINDFFNDGKKVSFLGSGSYKSNKNSTDIISKEKEIIEGFRSALDDVIKGRYSVLSNETELKEELSEIRYRQHLILSALRNLLDQNNKNGVNDYLIEQITRKLWKPTHKF